MRLSGAKPAAEVNLRSDGKRMITAANFLISGAAFLSFSNARRP